MADEQDQSIHATLFGQSVSAKGTSAIIILVLLVATIGAGVLLYDRMQQSEQHLDTLAVQQAADRDKQTKQMVIEHTAIVEAIQALKDVNESIRKGMDESTFINLANERERADMKKRLVMPESLRRKLDRGY